MQTGHTGDVADIALSPDGDYCISGGWDNTVRLWEVASGREVRAFRGHTRAVTSVAFSHDGRHVLSGSLDNTVRLWDVATGKELKAFKGEYDVLSAAMSPDGRYALSGDAGQAARLWDISSGKMLKVFGGHESYVYSVAFSPDGKYALTGSRRCRLWDVAGGGEEREFKADSSGDFESATFSPDGKYVLAGSTDKNLYLWNTASGEMATLFRGHEGLAISAAFSPDGKWVVSGSDFEDHLNLWQVRNGKKVKTLPGHPYGGISAVAFSPDGGHAFSGGGDETVRMWDVVKAEEVKVFGGQRDEIHAVAFSPDGGYALAGGLMTLRLVDARSGEEIRVFDGHVDTVRSAAFSPDGKYALSGSRHCRLWEVATGNEIRAFKGHDRGVNSVAFSPDGELALTGGKDETVRLWEVETGEELKVLDGHTGEVYCVAFSPDGKHALSGGLDKTIRLWDLAAGKKRKVFTGHQDRVWSVAFSPDGSYVVSGGGGPGSGYRPLRLWEVETGKEKRIFQGLGDSVYSVAFSPDGRYVLSGSYDQTIRLWDVATGKQKTVFQGHTNSIYSVAFGPDGKTVISGSLDGSVRFWNVETGKELARSYHFEEDEWIVITPEGYFNASAHGAKSLNVSEGMNVYAIDQFFEQFFNPTIVARVLRGEQVKAERVLPEGFASPPEVRIVSPKSGESFDKETIDVMLSAEDTGGGIDELRLYHNGKAVGDERRAIQAVSKGKTTTKKYSLTLAEGENLLRAVAFSKDRVESDPYEVAVCLSAPAKEVALHLFVVGINAYKNPALNLNYAEPDARGIADFFRKKGGKLFKSVHVVELYSQQATGEAIRGKLVELTDTHPRDVVVIFLAGHGESVGGQWYFVPYEVTYPEREEEIRAKAISSKEIAGYVEKIGARKILMLLDSCKAGAALVAFRGYEDRRALMQLARAAGVHIVAAATKDQYSAEVKDLGHGVFTHTILVGLRMGAASGEQDTITVRRLLAFVEERLPGVSKKYKREAQYPVVSSRGMDFPLAIAK